MNFRRVAAGWTLGLSAIWLIGQPGAAKRHEKEAKDAEASHAQAVRRLAVLSQFKTDFEDCATQAGLHVVESSFSDEGYSVRFDQKDAPLKDIGMTYYMRGEPKTASGYDSLEITADNDEASKTIARQAAACAAKFE